MTINALNRNDLTWRLVERLTARTHADEASPDMTVFPNARITGAISGTNRQIDVLIDARWDDGRERRIIVDAKHRRRFVDIKQVESFEGMMRDCRASYGVLVCTSGFTEAAKRRAQCAISLRLIGPEELETFTLDTWDDCQGRCSASTKRWSSSGLVLWERMPHGLAINDSPLSIMLLGKCDVCGDFNIWCWDCGQKFALADDSEFKCACDWFWLTATEDEDELDGTLSKSVLLRLILLPTYSTRGAAVVLDADRKRLS